MSGSFAKARISALDAQCGEGKGSDFFFHVALMPPVVRLGLWDRTPFGHSTPTKCLTVNVGCGSLTLVLTSCQSLTSSQCKSPTKLPYFFQS